MLKCNLEMSIDCDGLATFYNKDTNTGDECAFYIYT